MTNVNVFTIIGRLTADAEEFTIGNNTYVGFRVAVDRGQNKESSFLPVRAPKKFISDNLRAKLIKGAPVLVTGRFESGSYDKDGQKKYYTYLSAATIQHDVNGNFADGMLMGNLTADVTTRSTQNGNNIANFTVASNRSYQKDGQWVDVPSFVAVAAFGKLAEFIASKFHKGDPIMVAGTLSSYSYKNKDGENRTSYTVWADKAAFASRGKDTAQNSTPAPAATPASAPASAPAPSAPTYGEYGADEFDAVEEEDDLPF